MGNSDNLKAGQTILSIGNPLGYSHSVSRGVIAAIRELEFGDGRPMVQIAIPIEPGSSGSPVLDLQGNVIAMLTIKSGGAMGFGIPVNALKKLLDEKTDPIPMEKWKTIGAIDPLEWSIKMDGNGSKGPEKSELPELGLVSVVECCAFARTVSSRHLLKFKLK